MQSRGFIGVQAVVWGLIIFIAAFSAALAFVRAQSAAADRKRIADVTAIQSALKLFYDTNGFYPTGHGKDSPAGMDIYLDYWPDAPLRGCDIPYNYSVKAAGQDSTLSFCLDDPHQNLAAGNHILTSRGVQ